jgi:hypothetical protein
MWTNGPIIGSSRALVAVGVPVAAEVAASRRADLVAHGMPAPHARDDADEPTIGAIDLAMDRIRRTSFIQSLFTAAVASIATLAGCVRREPAPEHSTQSMMDRMSSMMGGGMMNVSQSDMRAYMEMFDHHTEIRRHVEELPDGIRTVTESDNPRIAGLLHAHVSDMYRHVETRQEVRCMSDSLPTMFRNASRYRRRLEFTRKGVAVVETSSDPIVLAAISRHANEISGFVREGMPAMMRGMMQQ